MSNHISRKIKDWFDGERQNHGWQRSQQLQAEIDAAILEMPEPRPKSAEAWKAWSDFENDTSRVDPGLYKAMTLCKYAEWCADVDLGLTTDEFAGVPCIVLTTSPGVQS